MYPVDVYYSPLLDDTNYLEATIEKALEIHRDTDVSSGDILVFLTGAEEVGYAIDKFSRASARLYGHKKTRALALFGKQQSEERVEVFSKLPAEVRKVVFATDVAETSITIDGVRFVIDSGMSKESIFDPRRQITVLETRRISKSSAEQRRGRAGRTSSGVCYRLYSEEECLNMRNTQVGGSGSASRRVVWLYWSSTSNLSISLHLKSSLLFIYPHFAGG